MKIAVIGGAGFIGSHVAKAYLDAGHDVFVIDTLLNGSRQALDPRARFYQVDLRDPQLRTIMQAERPELVSHHAVPRDQGNLPREQSLLDADIQVRGLLNVLDSCVSASVEKLIFASGGNDLYSHVDCERLPLAEHATLCPLQPQEISKQAAEWYIRYYSRQYGLAHTIFRYADVYGETVREHIRHPLSYMICMLLEEHRPTIRHSADELRDHIFIDDVVQANLCALEHGRNQTLNISTGEGHTLSQFYQAVAVALHSKIEPIYITNSLVFGLPAGPTAITLDNSLAQQKLGWHPQVSFAAGIQTTINRVSEHLGVKIPVTARQPEMALAGV
ncbi:MAG TPA: NAD-dependent epimerase/dehydratase family protein [Ktedonobacteraceae bacterium]|nr:NAD-dependent epimerase/dehydratase family protein [Ktedonobacteraceae bacterium]